MVQREEVVALVTAAGASTRMGSPKALVEWPKGSGTTLLAHQLRALAGLRDVVIVTGAHPLPVPAPARAIHNQGWESGRSSSIEVGANALAAGHAILVCAVDQPIVAEVLDALLAAFERDDQVLEPAFGERRGHPLLLAPSLHHALCRAASFDEGLRGLVRAHRRRSVPVTSPLIHLDLNTPEDIV